MRDPQRLITDRLRQIDASGIRRVFDLAATLEDPINLSIGQPDFDVPEPVKDAAAEAIRAGFNRYTQTQGAAELRQRVIRQLQSENPATYGRPGDPLPDDLGLLITSGVSGGLMLTLLTCVGPGDEVLIPDPYFVMYKHLVTLAGATPVYIDTYPDFQLTAERIDAHITPRTKLLLFNSPSNPTGVVAPPEVCQQVAELCRRNDILLLTDEIYDEFCYEKAAREPGAKPSLPSPTWFDRDALLLRGYSKTYGMTGWRLGYAVGPKVIVEQMTKLQQYSFVCAPSMAQLAGVAAMEVDMSGHVEAYRRKRDRVVEALSPHYQLTTPGGAFYAFPAVPPHLGISGDQFVERAIEQNLLIIPGSVFSRHDSHFRLSYACDDATLERGLEVLIELAKA
ncbi:MAG: aminotransferase class I/II-fold pyridoxal phosphate-dependent enzyme [Planctomycetes bacterium]|jgi:aspartate/methionine/tyrosine aminotransferase|nr:aminotransferase class I/II-fold pyridoxal phosphate-dependent enzyme [Planctomycetota bacterium]